MANIKSAIKRIRTAKRNEQRNKSVKSALKSLINKAKSLVSAPAKDAEAALREALKRIDKAVSKGIIHKKTAARKKSRLVKSLASKKKK